MFDADVSALRQFATEGRITYQGQVLTPVSERVHVEFAGGKTWGVGGALAPQQACTRLHPWRCRRPAGAARLREAHRRRDSPPPSCDLGVSERPVIRLPGQQSTVFTQIIPGQWASTCVLRHGVAPLPLPAPPMPVAPDQAAFTLTLTLTFARCLLPQGAARLGCPEAVPNREGPVPGLRLYRGAGPGVRPGGEISIRGGEREAPARDILGRLVHPVDPPPSPASCSAQAWRQLDPEGKLISGSQRPGRICQVIMAPMSTGDQRKSLWRTFDLGEGRNP